MKLRSPYNPLIIFSIALFAIAILPACSTWQAVGYSASAKGDNDSQSQPTSPAHENEPQSGDNSSQTEDMVIFEGTIFVASIDLDVERWNLAGWRISDQPINTEIQEPPPDCTLYPHMGVENQWVGCCKGLIRVPRDGALHINVILFNDDGSTTSFQVAPEPDKK